MKAKIIKTAEYPSEYGGKFIFAFFKSEEGKSFRTCLFPKCGNFQRWLPVLTKVKTGQEVWLDGLILKGKNLIDADSIFKVVS